MSEFVGGAERDRTADPLLAKQVLSQLSYSPSPTMDLPEKVGWIGLTAYARKRFFQYTLPPRRSSARREYPTHLASLPIMVGLGRIELPTSRLSGVRSNHLSYRPDGLTLVQPNRCIEGGGP